MELRVLTTLLKVAQFQGFPMAAGALGDPRSASAVHVPQLETELGVRLFDRIGKNVTITHYGQEFIPYARDVITAATKAVTFAVEDRDLTGTLRIGTIESILMASFQQILPEFHRRCPHVKTELFVAGTRELAEMLLHNELDLIYTLDDMEFDPQRVKLFEVPEDIVIIAGKKHPLASAETLQLRELVNEQFVLMPKSNSYRQLFDAELARQKLEVHPFLELDSTGMTMQLLEEQPYLSVLPRYTARHDAEAGKVVILPVADCHMEQRRQLVHHKVITPQIRVMASVISDVTGIPLTVEKNA